MERIGSFDGGNDGEESKASWVQEVQGERGRESRDQFLLAPPSSLPDNDSLSGLDTLDPQKREMLEARFLGKVRRLEI